MSDNLAAIKSLIYGLKNFKPVSHEATYLEICRYPSSRFEEINSRILSFFFQPGNPHRLGTLFLDVVSGLLNVQNADWIDTVVETEVMTPSGNRIDILIRSRSCVICIENKIRAELYNDLNDYRNFVETAYESVPEKKFFVLSMRTLNDGELQKCKDAGFDKIYYRDFIRDLKANVGSFMTGCNQRYLSYLIDWFQTMENEENGMGSNFSSEEKKFIQEHYEDVKNFMDRVGDYDRECESAFKDSIRQPIQDVIKFCDASLKEYWRDTWFLFQSATKVDGVTYGIDCVNFSRKPYSSEVDSFWIRIRSWGGQKKCEPVFSKIKEKFGESIRKEYEAPGAGGGSRYVEVHREMNPDAELNTPKVLAQWLLEQKQKLDRVLE